MNDLQFSVTGANATPYAAAPTITFDVRITDPTDAPIHAIALRCLIKIEPQRRRYERAEEEQLVELFGETPRWMDTLRPFTWAQVSTMVPAFTGTTDIEVAVPCTYDLDVASAKYLHGVDQGEIPVVLLFSGSVFTRKEGGFDFVPVPWQGEASYRLPVDVWRTMMDQYFPGEGWLRLPRDTIDALQQFKAARALPTWEQAIETLLKEAGE